jgi:hypothetical protein
MSLQQRIGFAVLAMLAGVAVLLLTMLPPIAAIIWPT